MSLYVIRVGISVYKQPLSWLMRCIGSVLRQSSQDWHLVIRLDGPDALSIRDKQILFEYVNKASSNQKIKLIDDGERLGCFGSYKKIFEDCDSEYLCQVDADDYLAPTALEDSLSCMHANPSAPFVYSYCGLMNDENDVVGLDQRALSPWSKALELTRFVTYHFRLIRSKCYFDVGGYDADYFCAGDYDLCLRLSELSEPVLIDKVLYLYRVHASSSSQVSQSITHRESVLAARSALKRRGFHHSCLLDSPAHESVVRIDEFNGPIFIAGLHRSGTSLLCRILSSFGFSFPGPLFDSDDDNPTGYYENTDLVALHRQWFSGLPDDAWRDWGLSQSRPLSSLGCFEWYQQALAFLQKCADQRSNSASTQGLPFWALKDPRATLLLPFWRESSGQKLLLMAVYRRPWDASNALMRIGFSLFRERPDLILDAWFAYNKALLNFIKAFPHQSILLASDRLPDSPAQLLSLLNQRWDLGLETVEVHQDLFAPNQLKGLPYAASLDRLYSHVYPHISRLFSDLNSAADLPTCSMDVGSCQALVNSMPSVHDPLVSIVIPTWNPGHFLLEAIASAEYSVGNVSAELIIVDDGSDSRDSMLLLSALRQAGYRVVSQRHSGLSSARNRGFDSSKAKYVIPLDDDNRLLPPYFDQGLSLLEKDIALGWVYGDQLNFGADSSTHQPGDFDLKQLRSKNYIDACCLIRKSMWHSVGGYDPLMPALEDWDFWLKCSANEWSGQYLHMPCFEYRVRENSLLRRHLADEEQHRDVVQRLRDKYGGEMMYLND